MPADRLTQRGSAILDQAEQFLRLGIERFGRAAHPAVAVDQHLVVVRNPVNQGLDRGVEQSDQTVFARANIEPQHRVIRHNIVSRAALDFRGVDAEPISLQRLQPKRQRRRRDNRVAPVLRIAPGVGGAAGDDQTEVSTPAARAGQRAIGQGGRFVGQRRELARRALGDQPGRGEAASFLVRIDQHVIADPGCIGRRFQRLQGCRHDCDPALHIGDTRPIERIGIQPDLLLKRMISRKHRVHMTGQQQPPFCIGPHGQQQMCAVRHCKRLAIGSNRSDRGRFDQLQRARQAREGVGQNRSLLCQPRQIAGAGVDRAPGLDLRQHGGAIDRVNQPGFGCANLLHMKPS